MVKLFIVTKYVLLSRIFQTLLKEEKLTKKRVIFIGEPQKGLYISSSSSKLLKLGKIYTVKEYIGDLIVRISLEEVDGLFDPNWFKEL